MTPERLAEIREMYEVWDWIMGNPAKIADTVPELVAYIDQLTTQRDDARRLALPAFTSSEGDLSEHTHVLDTLAVEAARIRDEFPGIDEFRAQRYGNWTTPDRPSAYDMPVGSVVVSVEHTYTRTGSDDWRRKGQERHRIRSGWIEGLFSDGLVTEWRLP